MNVQRFVLFSIAILAIGFLATSVQALPLITSVVEVGTGLNANPAIATSATSRLPQPEGPGTSGALVDETYAYVTRTHEWTAARTNNTTGLLSTTEDATTSVRPFPSYLNGLEYIQVANENRTVADYSLNVTLSNRVRAYLFLDNRIDGLGGGTNPNTSSPVLTGPLAWVVADGWTRVNTGFMPNGQPDFIGIDEGATVANPTLRTHPATVGSGVGLNQFLSIYTKTFNAGANVGFTKAQASGNIDMYGVAVRFIPEPGTCLLSLLAFCGATPIIRRR